MNVDRETAFKIWESYFDHLTEVQDAFGRLINKANFGTNGLKSWTIDHIWPKNPLSDTTSQEGANTYSNVQPLHWKSNLEKNNNLQGAINGISFAIKKIDENEGKAIGRMKVKDDNEWFWAYDEPIY